MVGYSIDIKCFTQVYNNLHLTITDIFFKLAFIVRIIWKYYQKAILQYGNKII